MSGNNRPSNPKSENEGNKSKGGRYRNFRKGGRGKNTSSASSGNSTTKYKSQTFLGKTPELKGFYFDAMNTSQAEGFNKTKIEILGYLGRRSITGPRVKRTLEVGTLQAGSLPIKPKKGSGPNADDILEVELDLYKEEIRSYNKTRTTIRQELELAFGIIIGQCTPLMIQRLEGNPDFLQMQANLNPIDLLAAIRNVNFKFEDQTYIHENIFYSLRNLMAHTKGPEDDLIEHRDRLKNKIEVVEQFGDFGKFAIIQRANPAIALLRADMDKGSMSPDKYVTSLKIIEDLSKANKNQFMAFLYLTTLDDQGFGSLKRELHNAYAMGNTNVYPKTIDGAIKLENNFRLQNPPKIPGLIKRKLTPVTKKKRVHRK